MAFKLPGAASPLMKQMLGSIVLGVVLAVPVAFYQAGQIQKERGAKATQDRAEATKTKQIEELRRCKRVLATVDEHCSGHKMGEHCDDQQCVLAIKAVVAAGATCGTLLQEFKAAQQSGVVALMQCGGK